MNMKALLCLVLAGGFVLAGCASGSKAKLQQQQAFLAGQQQALAQSQQSGPTVSVRGEVRHTTIPWTEELTLAQAILGSEYKGLMAPSEIVVFRKGVAHPIILDRFLRGLDDPPLEPGDIVDLRR